MPEAALYPHAVSAVEQWLDGTVGVHAVRLPPAQGEIAAWRIPARDERWPELRVALPFDFPASPPRVRVPEQLHLQVPHIEFDGGVCHGIAAKPNGLDYLLDVLEQARYLVEQNGDPSWREAEFHRERASYWVWFSRRQRSRIGAPRTLPVRLVDAPPDGTHGEVLAVQRRAFIGRTRDRLNAFVNRHGYAGGTVSYGSALFIGVPDTSPWTPLHWPREFPDLVRHADAFGFGDNLRDWLPSSWRNHDEPRFVVFRVGRSFFAYQVFAPAVPRLMPPGIEPVPTEREDVLWCLSRDHEAQLIETRLQMRIVILGCGSLGSHLAAHVVRAGIGRIDLVDAQDFGAENVARHVLGMRDIGKNKAVALARELERNVPGVVVKGHEKDALSWLRRQQHLTNVTLIVDATGEQGVRLGVRRLAAGTPLATVWAEPFCAGAHLVLLPDAAMWPEDDPADGRINAYDWPAPTQVLPPACSTGFHPYGDADIAQVAAFCAERIIEAITHRAIEPVVWSQIRDSQAAANAQGRLRQPLPPGSTLNQSRRNWADVVR